jgi:hypothetical protein
LESDKLGFIGEKSLLRWRRLFDKSKFETENNPKRRKIK